jgi:hypothetical protein
MNFSGQLQTESSWYSNVSCEIHGAVSAQRTHPKKHLIEGLGVFLIPSTSPEMRSILLVYFYVCSVSYTNTKVNSVFSSTSLSTVLQA